MRFNSSPLPTINSHGNTVSGGRPAAKRARNSLVSLAGNERGTGPSGSSSASRS